MTAPRALVVDDDAAIRILVSRVLTREGFEVDVASDGAQAIEQILQHEYGVVVLDLMMPRIDGVGVVRYLARHKPDTLGNVIVMTAFGAAALEKVSPPVSRFIEKPFDIEVLVAHALECGQSGPAGEAGDAVNPRVSSAVAAINVAKAAEPR